MKAEKFQVPNLNNSYDIMLIKRAVFDLDGINSVRTDTVSNTVTVDYDDQVISSSEILSKIKSVHNMS
jgi:copper chaperone CopZ